MTDPFTVTVTVLCHVSFMFASSCSDSSLRQKKETCWLYVYYLLWQHAWSNLHCKLIWTSFAARDPVLDAEDLSVALFICPASQFCLVHPGEHVAQQASLFHIHSLSQICSHNGHVHSEQAIFVFREPGFIISFPLLLDWRGDEDDLDDLIKHVGILDSLLATHTHTHTVSDVFDIFQ